MPDGPYDRSRITGFVAGKTLAEAVEPYFAEVADSIRSRLFDTIGHLDVVKRWLVPWFSAADFAAIPEVYEPLLVALVESGMALEVNSSGLRHRVGETYPGPWVVRRFRELGGQRVTTGSDSHLPELLRVRTRGSLRDRGRRGLRPVDAAAGRGPRRPGAAGPVPPVATLAGLTTGRQRGGRPVPYACPMELIVIGAGPAYTDRRGAAGASYLVRAEGAALLLDLGQGAFPNLASTMEPSALTAVLVSHLHPDHFIDLVPLRHYLKWEFEPPRRVAVVAPAGLVRAPRRRGWEPGLRRRLV